MTAAPGTSYVALLRAVNVGGTGALPMTALVRMCEAAGFERVRTYIATGNAVFRSERSEVEVRTALESQLHSHAGRNVGVIVRTASELADVLARNPFPAEPGNRVMVLFIDGPLPTDRTA